MTVSTAGPDSLLSAPLTAGVRAEGRFPRPNTENLGYENTGQQFRITNTSKNYNSQFYKVTVTAFCISFIVLQIQRIIHCDVRFTMPDWRP